VLAQDEFVDSDSAIATGSFDNIYVGLNSSFDEVSGVDLTFSGGDANAVRTRSDSLTDITGGVVRFLNVGDTSVVNILGGTVGDSLTGPGVNSIDLGTGGVINLRGGSVVDDVRVFGVANVFGGTVGGAFVTPENGQIIFNGLDFSFRNVGSFGDGFSGGSVYAIELTTTSGVISYTVNDVDFVGEGSANPERQFSFVQVAVVPEAGTFALALPALGMVGAVFAGKHSVVIRRRKK
jgi:hypothetical protein